MKRNLTPQQELLIRPEIWELGNQVDLITLEQWEKVSNGGLNSYERAYLLPNCSNEVLLQVASNWNKHVGWVSFPSSYEEAIVHLLFPLICTRLANELPSNNDPG